MLRPSRLAAPVISTVFGGAFRVMKFEGDRELATKRIRDNHHLMIADAILTNPLQVQIARAIGRAGGWLPFDAFMNLALYAPGLGYYANAREKLGWIPQKTGGQGGDFVTAPEMTSLFGQTLATQIAQALQATQTSEIWEFGAGTGALARDVLDELSALGAGVSRYTIVDVSGSLRERQQKTLAAYGAKVHWVDALPRTMQGVVIGNEVLDAMPVKLLARQAGVWLERGVALAFEPEPGQAPEFAWADRVTALRPPVEILGNHDYLTEIHLQGEAFIRTLADRLTAGAVFMIDYGFPEAEYYHPQRHMGTVMCHQAHRSDANPLADVGLKDITAHVNFTALALAGQDAGLDVLGYATQARFLMNCGLLERLQTASVQDKVMAQKLIMEHEMGELFKVIGFSKSAANVGDGKPWQAIGFTQGDRTHTL
jgi:SAM-dependent MidA family methyltransferase